MVKCDANVMKVVTRRENSRFLSIFPKDWSGLAGPAGDRWGLAGVPGIAGSLSLRNGRNGQWATNTARFDRKNLSHEGVQPAVALYRSRAPAFARRLPASVHAPVLAECDGGPPLFIGHSSHGTLHSRGSEPGGSATSLQLVALTRRVLHVGCRRVVGEAADGRIFQSRLCRPTMF